MASIDTIRVARKLSTAMAITSAVLCPAAHIWLLPRVIEGLRDFDVTMPLLNQLLIRLPIQAPLILFAVLLFGLVRNSIYTKEDGKAILINLAALLFIGIWTLLAIIAVILPMFQPVYINNQ